MSDSTQTGCFKINIVHVYTTHKPDLLFHFGSSFPPLRKGHTHLFLINKKLNKPGFALCLCMVLLFCDAAKRIMILSHGKTRERNRIIRALWEGSRGKNP